MPLKGSLEASPASLSALGAWGSVRGAPARHCAGRRPHHDPSPALALTQKASATHLQYGASHPWAISSCAGLFVEMAVACVREGARLALPKENAAALWQRRGQH